MHEPSNKLGFWFIIFFNVNAELSPLQIIKQEEDRLGLGVQLVVRGPFPLVKPDPPPVVDGVANCHVGRIQRGEPPRQHGSGLR